MIYWSRTPIYPGDPPVGSTGAGASDTSVIGYVLRQLDGSPWLALLRAYPPVDGHLVYDRYLSDTTHVPSPDSSVAWSRFATEAGRLAAPNTVVIILTGPGLWPSDLAGCAFHESAGATIYAVVPYAFNTDCGAAIARTAPNDPGTDAILTSLVHELVEAATDPVPYSGWARGDGEEIADLCNRQYGPTYSTANGGVANLRLGTKDVLIQELWTPSGCVL